MVKVVWPTPFLDLLTGLADTQQYSDFWKAVLLSTFPSRLHFQVLPGDKNESEEIRSRCWRVYHPSVQNFFLLTWSAPAPVAMPFAPYHGECQTSATFHGSRIYRIESVGTRFLLFHLSKISKIGDLTMYDEEKDPNYWPSPDVDALDSFGVTLLIAHARRSCRYMSLPCSSDEEFLHDVHVSMLEWQARQGLPIPLPASDEMDSFPRSHAITDIEILKKPTAPIGRTLPYDILHQISVHVSRQDLRSFALASRETSEIGNRRLWTFFRLHTGESHNVRHLVERLDALLRVLSRARYVRSLVIGPVTWRWDAPLLARLSEVWALVPCLTSLELRVSQDFEPRIVGGEFAPVLRGLVQHGSHLRLKSFSYFETVLPRSTLEDLLRTQPTIEKLYDLGRSRFRSWKHGPEFLPALQELRCGARLTASLVSGRRVLSIECAFHSRQEAEVVFRGLEASSMELRCFTAREQNSLEARTHHIWFLQRLVVVAPALRVFCSRRMADKVDCRQVLGQLQYLEALVCHRDLSKLHAQQMREWVSPLGPRVHQVVYLVSNRDRRRRRAGVWERIIADTDSEPTWQLKKLTHPEAHMVVSNSVMEAKSCSVDLSPDES